MNRMVAVDDGWHVIYMIRLVGTEEVFYQMVQGNTLSSTPALPPPSVLLLMIRYYYYHLMMVGTNVV